MIRSETEYKAAIERLEAEKDRLADHKVRLKEKGLSEDDIQSVLDPIVSFHLQLAEEVQGYEKLKRREFSEIENFHGLGLLLVAVRIALGISQRELANRLGVNESQVSRDERNEYFGITVERVAKVAGALGIKLRTSVKVDRAESSDNELELA